MRMRLSPMRLAILLHHRLNELRNAKQVVHALQRQALRLRNQEPHEEEHRVAEARVDKERTNTTYQHNSKQAEEPRREGKGNTENCTYPYPCDPTVASILGV